MVFGTPQYDELHAHVLQSEATPLSESLPYGPVVSGHIVVEGPLKRGFWHSVKLKESDGRLLPKVTLGFGTRKNSKGRRHYEVRPDAVYDVWSSIPGSPKTVWCLLVKSDMYGSKYGLLLEEVGTDLHFRRVGYFELFFSFLPFRRDDFKRVENQRITIV